MTERSVAERILKELHAARVAGDLAAMTRLFAERGLFRIVGAGADKPISIVARDLGTFRPSLSMLVKVFRVTDYRLLSFVYEASRATAHWRADIHSKITGIGVPTEFVDLLEFAGETIVSYSEFFVPEDK